MKSIIHGWTFPRLLGLAVAVVALGLVAGAAPAARVSAQQTGGSGTVTVTKALALPNGTLTQGDLSGYSFIITPVGTSQGAGTSVTNAQGLTQPLSLPAGNYSISEVTRPSATLVDFRINGNSIGAPTGFFVIPSGGNVNVFALNQVAGTASISISKQIVDANNNVVGNADTSGFTFQVQGPSGGSTTVTSLAGGAAVTVGNLAPGQYTVTEQSRNGFTFVQGSAGGTLFSGAGASTTFILQPGQNQPVIFQNRQSAASGAVSIQKNVVDAAGNIVSSADRANFSFTLTCGTAVTTTVLTDASGIANFANVTPGTCTIREAPRSGFELVSIIPSGATDIGNNGTITVTAGQTTQITVRNRATQAQGQTEQVQLFVGCNNQALTWPTGTSVATVAAAVSPPSAVIAIWRYDNAAGRFLGFSPSAPSVSDYTVVSSNLETVFICVNATAVLNRPVR